MLTLLRTEYRGAGWAWASLCYLSYPRGTLVACLQRHPLASHPWQARIYEGTGGRVLPLWESENLNPASLALDALLESLAPFGLPDDLFPLVNTLLPQAIAVPADTRPL